MIALICGCLTDTGTTPLPNDQITPDTTSHDFMWKIDTIGTPHSYFRDVYVVDRENIWIVGEIHTEETDQLDSLGQWIQPYNALHWNGEEYEYLRFKYTYQDTTLLILPINGIAYISADNIWLTAGSIFHYNGTETITDYLRGPSEIVRNILINSRDELWAIGRDGLILYNNGIILWRKILTPTQSDILDIWSDGNKVMCVASERYSPGESRLFVLSTTTAKDTLNWLNNNKLNGVWFSDYSQIYTCGSDINIYYNKEWHKIDLSNYFTTKIRGSHKNNVFVVGEFGIFAHYNGSTWYSYNELTMQNGSYESLAVKDEIVVAVGDVNSRGIIVKGFPIR